MRLWARAVGSVSRAAMLVLADNKRYMVAVWCCGAQVEVQVRGCSGHAMQCDR